MRWQSGSSGTVTPERTSTNSSSVLTMRTGSGAGLGLPVLIALVGGLLERSVRGGTIVVGALNLGGSVERLPKPVEIAELAVERQAAVLLMPVSARRDLFDLPDDLWTRINIEFYADPVDAAFKALVE